MNSLHIIGNLTRKPELRATQDGTSVCSFTVAVNRPKTRNNQNPGADYFNVTAWREKGEVCAKYLDKGSKVSVVGSVSLRTWETETKHGANLEVNAQDIEFLSSRSESAPVDEQTGMTKVETDELPY